MILRPSTETKVIQKLQEYPYNWLTVYHYIYVTSKRTRTLRTTRSDRGYIRFQPSKYTFVYENKKLHFSKHQLAFCVIAIYTCTYPKQHTSLFKQRTRCRSISSTLFSYINQNAVQRVCWAAQKGLNMETFCLPDRANHFKSYRGHIQPCIRHPL